MFTNFVDLLNSLWNNVDFKNVNEMIMSADSVNSSFRHSYHFVTLGSMNLFH